MKFSYQQIKLNQRNGETNTMLPYKLVAEVAIDQLEPLTVIIVHCLRFMKILNIETT